MVEIKLSDGQFDAMMLALGYATGAALKDGNKALANSFVRLTNAVGSAHPNFVPYQVTDEVKQA